MSHQQCRRLWRHRITTARTFIVPQRRRPDISRRRNCQIVRHPIGFTRFTPQRLPLRLRQAERDLLTHDVIPVFSRVDPHRRRFPLDTPTTDARKQNAKQPSSNDTKDDWNAHTNNDHNTQYATAPSVPIHQAFKTVSFRTRFPVKSCQPPKHLISNKPNHIPVACYIPPIH